MVVKLAPQLREQSVKLSPAMVSHFSEITALPINTLPLRETPGSPCEVFVHQLQDLHAVEDHLASILPDLTAMTGDRELRQLIEMHAFRAGRRATRLREVLEKHGVMGPGMICPVMHALSEAGLNQFRMMQNSLTKDMMVLSHYQRINHYAMAGYSVAATMAESLDKVKELDFLECPLVEHRTVSRRLEAMEERLFGEKFRRANASVMERLFSREAAVA